MVDMIVELIRFLCIISILGIWFVFVLNAASCNIDFLIGFFMGLALLAIREIGKWLRGDEK